MKVLLVFPQKDGQTGVFIKKAFEQYGCLVEVVDAKTHPGTMVPKCKNFKPDLLFCSRTPSLLNGIKKIRKEMPQIVTSCWNVDTRDSVKQFGKQLLDLFNNVHLFYTIALGNVAEYKELCPKTEVHHLQQGCDPDRHKMEKPKPSELKIYECDVMFAGSYKSTIHHGRVELIEFLKRQNDIKFNLYGYENHITDSEQNKAHFSSKIVLGNSGWPNVAISMSVREYKIMASGGFLLAQYCKDMEKWFKIGEECDVYKTKEECLKKINYYLKNEDRRKAIALNGYRTARTLHKYSDRIKKVLEDVKILRSRLCN